MSEPNTPREAVEQHRESLYPPLPPAELVDAHGFWNLERVVATQHGVYGRTNGGYWFQLIPIAVRLHNAAMAEMANIPGMPQETPMGEPSKVKFKVGDVVVLLSGGPRMTVWQVEGIVAVTWFAGDELRRDMFDAAELELAPAKVPA